MDNLSNTINLLNALNAASLYGMSGDSSTKHITDTNIEPTKPVDNKSWQNFCNGILNQSFRYAGLGSSTNIMQNFLSRLDRHGNMYAPTNSMNYGYTFITRPRFNLTSGNLLQNPVTALLAGGKVINANNVSFMIRMLMDSRLSRGQRIFNRELTSEDAALFEAAGKSGLVDIKNPFFVPLCNGLKGISGWPDFNLETATMGEDFHSGDFTFVKGSDMLVRTTELSLEFADVYGSVILSCMFYWCLFMALQAKGVMQAYPDDIYEQRLNYTVSIYRFITDNSRKYILWWSKATGCFPKSAPIGQLFNINQGEVTISSAKQFSIPFTVNVVEYNNPSIIIDFKKLVRDYAGDDFHTWKQVPNDDRTNTIIPSWNYVGLPDIVSTEYGLELVWRTNSSYYGDNWPTTTSSTTTASSASTAASLYGMGGTFNSNNASSATNK